MFLAEAAEDFTINAGLVITVLVIIVLFLGAVWLWTHRGR